MNILSELIFFFSTALGVNNRTAQKITLNVLLNKEKNINYFANQLIHLSEKIKKCKFCNNIDYEDICSICKDPARGLQNGQLLIVDNLSTFFNIEKINYYKGIYYILDKSDDIINDKDFVQLKKMILEFNIKELIIAMNTNSSGKIKTLHIADYINSTMSQNIKITILGTGIPQGHELEYLDDSTIISGIEQRREY